MDINFITPDEIEMIAAEVPVNHQQRSSLEKIIWVSNPHTKMVSSHRFSRDITHRYIMLPKFLHRDDVVNLIQQHSTDYVSSIVSLPGDGQYILLDDQLSDDIVNISKVIAAIRKGNRGGYAPHRMPNQLRHKLSWPGPYLFHYGGVLPINNIIGSYYQRHSLDIEKTKLETPDQWWI
jgi:hypothetical protein